MRLTNCKPLAALGLALAVLAGAALLQPGNTAHAGPKVKLPKPPAKVLPLPFPKPLPKPIGKPDPQIAAALAALKTAHAKLGSAILNEFDEPGAKLEGKVLEELNRARDATTKAINSCTKALKMDKRP